MGSDQEDIILRILVTVEDIEMRKSCDYFCMTFDLDLADGEEA